ncbi:MAG TPA: hypothetical protein VK973_17030 [Arenicellales bacterium]|nr:hypothetical protein [Arenicellales bacterium]
MKTPHSRLRRRLSGGLVAGLALVALGGCYPYYYDVQYRRYDGHGRRAPHSRRRRYYGHGHSHRRGRREHERRRRYRHYRHRW